MQTVQRMAKPAVAFGPIRLQSNLMRKLVVINGVESERTEIEVGEGIEGGVPP